MRFPIIYCDPPWEYNSRAPHSETRFGGGAGGHYDVEATAGMAEWAPQFEAMRPLPDQPGVMLMWVTMPRLEDGFSLMRAWGYHPIKPIWFWHKETPKGKTFKGPGYYTFSNIEALLLGSARKKTRLPRRTTVGRWREEVIRLPHPCCERGRIIHSRKPAIFRELIVEAFGDLPRVEVFARERVEGWHAIGNDLPGGEAIGPHHIVTPLPPLEIART